MNIKKCVWGLLVFFALSANAMAAKIPLCKHGVPSSEKNDLRDARIEAVNGQGTVFNNNENRLPGLSHNEIYREYYLGADKTGGAGTHRAVLLVLEGDKKFRVLTQYYTVDHYRNFCQLQ
ncbi:MAG TPA: ribonuclease domain-containing protein [Methylobacter sp.]|jgi:hypothetical protein